MGSGAKAGSVTIPPWGMEKGGNVRRHPHAHLAPVSLEIPADVQAMMAHIDALDPFLHQPTRLLLCWLAQQSEAASYETILEQQHLKPSALSIEVKGLEQRGIVTVERRLKGRNATAWVALTPKGREALSRHMQHLLAALELSSPREEAR